MKAEKVILSFVAVLIGLLAAAGVFYVYQMTKSTPAEKTKTIAIKPVSPTPTPNASNVLTITNPSDGSVVDNRSLTLTGKTAPDATVVVNTDSNDVVGKAAGDGSFSLQVPLDDGVTALFITAIFPDGTQTQVQRTVTYSTEDF